MSKKTLEHFLLAYKYTTHAMITSSVFPFFSIYKPEMQLFPNFPPLTDSRATQ